MKWSIGDKLRVLDASMLVANGVKNGGIYTVETVNQHGLLAVSVDSTEEFAISRSDYSYVCRVTDEE